MNSLGFDKEMDAQSEESRSSKRRPQEASSTKDLAKKKGGGNKSSAELLKQSSARTAHPEILELKVGRHAQEFEALAGHLVIGVALPLVAMLCGTVWVFQCDEPKSVHPFHVCVDYVVLALPLRGNNHEHRA